MKLKNIFYSVLLVFTLFISLPLFAKSPQQNTMQLGYRLKAGEAYSMKTITETVYSFTFDHKKFRENSTTTTDLLFDIIGVDSTGRTTAKVTYIDLSQTKSGTEQDDNAIQFTNLLKESMIGQQFEITFTSLGKIIEIKGHDEINKRICQSLQGNADLDEDMKIEMCKIMSKLFSAESLKSSFSMIMCIYPEKAEVKGKTWKISLAQSLMPSLNETKTFTLTANNNKDYHILQVTSLSSSPKNGALMDLGLLKMNGKLTGNGKGTINIHKESGWIYSSKHVSEVKGTATLLPNEYVDEKISFPYSCKYSVTAQSQKVK